ncbi:MAG: chromosomal replication initiator DnaA [Xanthobacteraceae bacterium]|nr:chromosomal replication initiator DnaA [Xanthobacteraceae bacterium]
MTTPEQLVLALGHAVSFAREDFLEGPSNAAALALIERWPDWPGRSVVLVGPEGSGKSHLAEVWVRKAGGRRLTAASLEQAAVPALIATGAVAVEDIAEGVDEIALFHLLNLAREQTAYLLLSARDVPVRWPIRLPDLASRVRALPIIELTAPDDALLRAVMIKLFSDRQLAVDESLIAYLITRIERSFAAARAVVALLDREALRQQRPVTRALAAELMPVINGG